MLGNSAMLHPLLGVKLPGSGHRRLPALIVAVGTQYLNQCILEPRPVAPRLSRIQLGHVSGQLRQLLLFQAQRRLGPVEPGGIERLLFCLPTDVSRGDLDPDGRDLIMKRGQPLTAALKSAGQSDRRGRWSVLMHARVLLTPGASRAARWPRGWRLGRPGW